MGDTHMGPWMGDEKEKPNYGVSTCWDRQGSRGDEEERYLQSQAVLRREKQGEQSVHQYEPSHRTREE